MFVFLMDLLIYIPILSAITPYFNKISEYFIIIYSSAYEKDPIHEHRNQKAEVTFGFL